MDQEKIIIVKKSENFKISEHLSHHEFRCQCQEPFCTHTLINFRIGVLFEKLRSICGNVPLHVTSGFRCAYNNHISGGSSPVSQHLIGQALDIMPPSHIRIEDFNEMAKEAGFTYTYFNRNKNFVHMDMRR
jgi:hypothetical protein